MYAAIGHPRHTIYAPIPIVAENIPMVMKKRKWSMKAFIRLDQLCLDASIPSVWTKFEKESMERYAAAKAEARKLLKSGKTSRGCCIAELCSLENMEKSRKFVVNERLFLQNILSGNYK